MQFSDTTNKNGIIQTIEFWCGMSDAEISGDSTKLKQFTARINSAFDRIAPFVLSYTDHLRWDDTNHADLPIATFNISSGQGDYTVSTDDNSLRIFNITGVRIKSNSSTDYQQLERVSSSDGMAERVMSPNSSDSGTPTHYLEFGNTLFLWPKPNYTLASGAKIFFEREPSYFASTDTTKEPGIPRIFHDLLPLYAALDWVLVYKPDNPNLIVRLEDQIRKRESQLSELIERRHPTQRSFITTYQTGADSNK